MHRDDRPGPRPDRLGDPGGIDVQGDRIDIHEHRARADAKDRVGGGHEREARQDHLVTRTEAGDHQRNFKCPGA
jgi:hypothetical protein